MDRPSLRRRRPRRGGRAAGLILAAATLVAIPLAPARAGSPAPTGAAGAKARLAAVRARIAALTRKLDADQTARDATASALRDIERRAGDLAREAETVGRELDDHRTRLAALGVERARRLERVKAERAALADQIRSVYAMGREDRLKLLFNLEDVSAAERLLTYHGYLARARSRRIAALRAALERLRAVEVSMRDETKTLEALAARQSRARAQIQTEREDRAALLARMDARIGSGKSRLARLKSDARKLQDLLKALARELADIPPALDRYVPFATLRGHLPWPAAGTLRNRFGTPRDGGNLIWSGVTIAGKRGTPVHAVSNGRVAFANWLRGFGLLMIIDHGDGYMTLYGHNETLYREVGDWVEAGDVIAAMGDSGGRPESGLYFEIRRRGTPVNPARWCAGEPRPPGEALITHRSG